MHPKKLTLPLILTYLRIAAIPLFVAVLYVPESWIAERTANVVSMWIFIVAAITDWADGYLARKWNQTTSFGAFLDPVADKLMVAAALIVLTEKGFVDPLATLIIISREITISALREWMAQVGNARSVAVNMLGKVKTVTQLVAIPFLLFNGVLFGLFHTNPLGRVLIWIAALITLWSMVVYLKAAMRPAPGVRPLDE
ncbi:MAG TPA: CDP-diacylglycerol--glycerol-3-phosphate 3-phosphatidyltransferase [Usitatibacteraceae bacterium]|jgi:CDP-diacylglycerol--glycerol-3-phosphate 3-phosphatidyltransferase|nr:CDP-diacylglycerol--glycerol-3-phosphate 3-phosphatidyltransferase [Usitatibacteraceae bacterium]